MDSGKTWYWHGGLVGWNYRPMARSDGRLVRLDLEESEIRRRWISNLVGRLPVLLGDFGYITEVTVYTQDQSPGVRVFDWRHENGRSDALASLQTGAISGMHARLDLTCQDRDLEHLEIADGADLLINIELTDSGALAHRTDAPVYLRLVLNADIYAPWSLGEIQDNALLAALNGPRLAGFLERIEREVPAELLEIDQDRHPRGSVGPRGFLAPARSSKGD